MRLETTELKNVSQFFTAGLLRTFTRPVYTESPVGDMLLPTLIRHVSWNPAWEPLTSRIKFNLEGRIFSILCNLGQLPSAASAGNF